MLVETEETDAVKKKKKKASFQNLAHRFSRNDTNFSECFSRLFKMSSILVFFFFSSSVSMIDNKAYKKLFCIYAQIPGRKWGNKHFGFVTSPKCLTANF